MRTNIEIFKARHSEKNKYNSIIFILIIAIPIGIILYLTLEGPIILSALMFAILIGILLLLAYFSFSAGSSRYELSSKNLEVRFGLIRKSVAYERIARVEIENLNLLIRLFGASLPGLHWGLFKTSVGNAHVYATKIKGSFILLTLDDGKKIVLSPEDPTSFLETLEERKPHFDGQIPEESEKETRSAKKDCLYSGLGSFSYVHSFFRVFFLGLFPIASDRGITLRF
jgi:hypothetical protein